MRLALILSALLALVGCAEFPEVMDEQRPPKPAGPPPALLPLDEVLAQAGTARVTPDTTASIEARAAALRARAEALRAAPEAP